MNLHQFGTLLIFVSAILSGCNNNEKKIESNYLKKVEVENKEFISNSKLYSKFELLKVINPREIDSSKSIAFIDTTYNSFKAKQIENWNLVKPNDWTDKEVLKTRSIDYFKEFKNSSKWFRIRKIENDFYRYERSDGSDTRYEISDKYLLIFGVHEPTVWKFDELKKPNRDLSFIEISKNSKNIATITETEFQDVYEINMSINGNSYSEYIAPRNKLKMFKTIVNYTPNNKQGELFNW